ncbi:hypothetical protein J7T55_001283 [Diaporthe amygdali]|uniref:uncharacterized protein n=1 Tax=Phomopsis amygdali TaxID=1214568 RepID=UPI0022FE9B2E|nr:uncharacterized protein J7T55_001283 [Diaporthe amygdali]KAJ0106759.1 hypothetical protein J7T55_001283 [Diaporthe amygdali]
MNIFTIFGLLANIIYMTVAAALPSSPGQTFGLAKRVESTFAWKDYFVRNCSAPLLYPNEGTQTIIADDCGKLSNWQSSNNGGYFELWDFSHLNNFTYKPIVGYNTCVIAISHAVSNDSCDYAVVGSLDVIGLANQALGSFQVNGTLPTISGSFVCGPNHAPLNILIYDGQSGWQGRPMLDNGRANFTVNATSIPGIKGPAGGTGYPTGSPPSPPAVSVEPASTTNLSANYTR